MASNCSDVQNIRDYNKMNEEVNYEEIQRDRKYEILDETEVMEFRNKTVERVNNFLPIPSKFVPILITYFKWDEEELLRKFYDRHQEKLFHDANIPNPFNEEIVATNRQEEEECLICCEYHQASGMGSLGCEHKYCNDCWSKYLENQILDEGLGENITCAAYGCTILMDSETCLGLLKNIRAEKVYKTMIVNSFVETNPSLRWCMGPDCTYAIRNVKLGKQEPIICKCGKTSCFTCGNDWHFPIQCGYFQKWLKKCQDDSATLNWIAINTKSCPKCNTSIEKCGGCNQMTCRNKSCRHQFCWICMGSWKTHSNEYYCSYFTKGTSTDKAERDFQDRIELERYLFHYQRYMDHKISLQLEKQLHESVYNKIKKLEIKEIPRLEMQFFAYAIDVLRQCRTTLMNSYPFAYYLEENNQCIIFSNNQRDLQNATEKLSGYLERNIETDNYHDIKRNIKDLRTYCKKRCGVLDAHILEGYEQGFWKYRDCERNSDINKKELKKEVKIAENSKNKRKENKKHKKNLVNYLKIFSHGFIILALLVLYIQYFNDY